MEIPIYKDKCSDNQKLGQLNNKNIRRLKAPTILIKWRGLFYFNKYNIR